MYTDPGSGLFFIQILIAAVLTLAFRFRRLLGSLVGKPIRLDSTSGD